MTKEKLLEKLSSIYQTCKNPNWDGHNAECITENTYKHGIRFINKLEKNGISILNLILSPLSDDNLTFKWSYDDGSSFNIDFDKSNDTLIWCCFKDENHIWNGTCVHFEDICENLKKYINYHERKVNENKK